MRHSAPKVLTPVFAAIFVAPCLGAKAGGAMTFNFTGSLIKNIRPDFAAIVAVPEPSTIVLAVLGGIGIFLLRRRKA